MMGTAIRHIHKRKTARLEKYPSPNSTIRLLDKITIAAAIFGPVAVLPQIYKIWAEQNASGFSPVTWGLLFLMNMPMIIYGVVHKEKPVILANVLWFLANVSIFLGVMLFG